MDLQQTLAQINDIHSPPPPGFWPLAAGWWWLLGITVVLLVATVASFWLLRRRKARLRIQKLSQSEWAEIAEQWQSQQNPAATVQRLANLIRRNALQRFGQQSVSALSGDQWLAFLAEQAPQLDWSSARWFGESRFSREQPQPTDAEACLQLAKDWIEVSQ